MAAKPRWYSFQSLRVFVVLLCLVLLAAFGIGSARTATPQRSRITQPVDERVRVTLKGNTHPLARLEYDRGAVSDSLPAERMLLLLRRSPEKEVTLRQFLQEAHTPGSASYHQWIKPEQFGELYGPEDSEIATVRGWLQKHGFSVARVTKGKTGIEFSGSAGQVREAFGTEIHAYFVNGEEHHANNRDPQIPAALAPVIAGITPMNDFGATPQVRVLGKALYDRKTHVAQAEWTMSNNPPLLALAPGDFAVEYDLNPLYTAGIDGTGVSIGIIGAANLYQPNVVADYRTFFGLPAGTLNIIIDGLDPGPSPSVNHGNFAEVESYLDVEVSGAVAPGTTVNLYTAADTSVQSGLLLAAQRAVDDDVAAVLSTSYGTCERALGSSGNQFWAALWEQAAAQGQTSFVSSGDNGSAGCDNFNARQLAQQGLAVNGFGSTPWNVSVGGTDFFYTSYNGTSSAQSAELATYWNMTAPSITTPSTSLLKPVPEQPWNQAFGLDLYDGGVYNPNQPTIVAGSGGASNCAIPASAGCAGYPKPAWQSGKGVPGDGVRDLPDVSLFAADGENDSFYPICLPDEGCTGLNPAFQEVTAIGGTSASSPAMAGIMALINQKYGRQGQANFILYPLATQHPSAFHDISIGSNDVPCQQGSPSCVLSAVNDNTKGFYTLGHYYAGPGYDQATGLGSVDANLLVQYWNSLNFTPSNTSLNLSQTSFTHGTPVNVSVAATGNGGTPTGDVGLLSTASPAAVNTSLSELTLKSGAASATVNNFPGGQYQLTARYAGDTVFAPSISAPVTLNVSPEASIVSVTGSYGNTGNSSLAPIANDASYPYGTFIVIDAQPLGVNAPKGGTDGIASGTVRFTDAAGSNSVSSGSLSLNAQGFAEWTPALSFPVGPNSLSASYSGDASFNASASTTPLSFTITKAATLASLFAYPSHVALGSPTQLVLDLSNQFSGPPCREDGSCTLYDSLPVSPTGTVTFIFGNSTLGTAPVLPDYGNLFASTVDFTVSTLPLGTDTVTASYSGDANYNSATATLPVVVENAATLSAVANPSTINQAEFSAITATLAGPNGLPVPTGTVTFSATGSTSWGDSEPLKNGSATSIALAGGIFFPPTNGQMTVPINISYSGDATYGPASGTASLTVTQGFLPPFFVGGTPVTIANPGATTGNTSTITVAPANGFTGAVYLSCVLTSSQPGAIHPPTCSVPSDALNIIGTGAATAVMTINSTAPSSSAGSLSLKDWRLPKGQPLLMTSAGMFVVCFLLLGVAAWHRNRRVLAASLFIFVICRTFVGCGGGSATTPPPRPINPGTTPGSYVFAVNAALSVNGVGQAQATVTVTIQ